MYPPFIDTVLRLIKDDLNTTFNADLDWGGDLLDIYSIRADSQMQEHMGSIGYYDRMFECFVTNPDRDYFNGSRGGTKWRFILDDPNALVEICALYRNELSARQLRNGIVYYRYDWDTKRHVPAITPTF